MDGLSAGIAWVREALRLMLLRRVTFQIVEDVANVSLTG